MTGGATPSSEDMVGLYFLSHLVVGWHFRVFHNSELLVLESLWVYRKAEEAQRPHSVPYGQRLTALWSLCHCD